MSGWFLREEIKELRDDVGGVNQLPVALVAGIRDPGLDIDEVATRHVLLDPLGLLLVEDRDLHPFGRGFPLSVGNPFPIGGDVHFQHIFKRYDVPDMAE